MMDIGAVYAENMIVLLLQLCVDNLDTIQQVSGMDTNRRPHLYF